jgi:hypothetical protein
VNAEHKENEVLREFLKMGEVIIGLENCSVCSVSAGIQRSAEE